MAKSYSVNLSVDEWRCVKDALLNDKNFCDDFNNEFMKSIVPKIDKKQRAQQNLQNTITRKNKLIKSLEEENEGLKGKIFELQNPVKEDHPDAEEDIKELKRKCLVQDDLINNLLADKVKNMDIDDGLCISKEYGHKYIDQWNKDYLELIKEHIEVMNKCELDGGYSGIKLVVHSHDNIYVETIESDEDEDE